LPGMGEKKKKGIKTGEVLRGEKNWFYSSDLDRGKKTPTKEKHLQLKRAVWGGGSV